MATGPNQPLMLRPGSQGPVAESGLPSGGPSDKGLPLSPDIPGTSTFNKKVDDIRNFDKAEDEPIYRTDNADDQLTDRSRIDTREDNADKHNGIGYLGRGEWDSSSKTKYPYRDGIPNHHNASAEFVAGRWLLRFTHTLRIPSGLRIATRPEQILTGLNPKFQDRATRCSVTLKRVDVPNMRWLFSVDGGNGAKVVRLRATRKQNVTRLSKMDVEFTCSCPGWRWLGPEHHAKREVYLDGSPRGTASVPVIRDPEGINRVCKHVAAVLLFTQGWEIPSAKKKE